ncbi:hypothetical protein [Papillibacter cinnamivorans]|uniref:Uncharacterized protein n=1 Tax=Papillibacter cinnamivorans DSM 12816 TaxID=1122930 RepID=A0A1W1YXN6_9FIRM|nr:hypothetical protein [Papillibacter cinnamivorans]SMC40959.1 hypothetical protein SAMN02745168_0760 [Papillibacter cinnamivorans DSM 12816]
MGTFNARIGKRASDSITRPANTTAYTAGDVIGTLSASATGTLTLTGVVKDGEVVSIGKDKYEFAADTDQTVGLGNIAVDITSYATKATGALTVDTQPTAGDTFTIGYKTYTFVDADTFEETGTQPVDGEIILGDDLSGTQDNIVDAINGDDGVSGAHLDVTAGNFSSDISTITALVGGTAGNSIATTSDFTEETNVFDAATLGTTTAGTDCTAANAVTALVAAITASDTVGVGGADGAGDTVVLTADTAGSAANSITTTETCANGSFGAATLTGGKDVEYLTFSDVSNLPGSPVVVIGASLRIDTGTLPTGIDAIKLHLYNTAPTAIADNSAYNLPSGDRSKYLGYLSIATPVDLGDTVWGQADTPNLSGVLASDSTTLYGILSTDAGWTPESGTVFTVSIVTIGV